MKLDELKKLADAAEKLQPKFAADEGTEDDLNCVFDFNHAANPQTILAMIALIEMQHEALANERYVSRYSHVVEALAAYDKFNGGE